MRKLILMSVMIAVMLFCGKAYGLSEYLLNGGFESGTGTDADDWTEGAGAIRETGVYSPHGGTWYVRTEGGQTGAIKQDIALLAGDYTLSGWLMTNDQTNTARAEVVGIGGFEFAGPGNPANFNWSWGEFDFTLASDQTVTVKLFDVKWNYFQRALFDDMSLMGPDAVVYKAGDTDKDMDVDGVDLATLGLNWAPGGTTKLWEHGNFDASPGTVDGVDLAALGLNWAPGGYGATPTPEPATLALMGLGVVSMLIRRKRR